MRKSPMSLGRWGVVFILLVTVKAGSLFAAEGTAHLTFQKTFKTNNMATYIIKKGDTINGIIRRMGVAAPRLSVLKTLNPQIADLNRIYPGQRLIIDYEEEKGDGQGATQAISNYTVKKGDFLTHIILSELKVPADDVAKIIRYVWSLNPGIGNVNKIYPGQTLKLPDIREAVYEKEESPVSVTTTPPKDETKPDAPIILPPANTLAIISEVIGQLNGTVIAGGNYYIPLPESGQVTINCATIPVAELDDGTTVLLDFTNRLPDGLAEILQASWENYHLLKLERGESVASVLKKIILKSKSYNMFTMAEAGGPLFIKDEPQVKLLPDWVINKKTSPEKQAPQLGLFFASDNTKLMPRPIVAYAKKKGVNICEIIVDKVRQGGDDAQANASPTVVPRIAGNNNNELLQNFFTFLGLETLRNREVKIFDTIKDGFDLSIKADWLVKRGNKTLLIHKNELPKQFTDVLRNDGMEPFHLAQGISKKSLLEGTLTALDIPSQFALFSMPEEDQKAKFAVLFSALRIDSDKGQFYLTNFDMDGDIYQLLKNYWKLNVVCY